MDWVGPAVTAAAVSGIISIVNLFMVRSTTLTTHQQKLDADRQLAERKVDADIALARAKFDYDREQAIFKRKFELAEQVLANAYRLRSIMGYVRNGFEFENEASARKAHDLESEAVKQMRDTYYIPQARLNEENKFLSDMFSQRTAFRAHFGAGADQAFDQFHQAIHRTRVASQLLIDLTKNFGEEDKETMDDLRNDIWQQKAKRSGRDSIGDDIDEAVAICERLCQPVLASKASL